MEVVSPSLEPLTSIGALGVVRDATVFAWCARLSSESITPGAWGGVAVLHLYLVLQCLVLVHGLMCNESVMRGA